MTHTVSEKIIKNTVFNALGRFWGILVTVCLTPYILGHIGIERYGVWAIVGVLTGYFSLLDFGMGTSFVKYISEYYAKKDYEGINQVVCTGVVFYFVFGALILPLAFMIMNPLLVLFGIPRESYSEAFFVFQVGIAMFAVSSIFSAFQAIQGGLQRMDVSSKIAIGVSVPTVLGTIYVLENGYGLRGLILNNAVILTVTSVVNIVIGFRIFPELKFSPALFSGEMLKKLFAFGFKLQFAKISDVIVFQTDRLLIAYFLNVSAAGFYQLGSSITQQMRLLPLLLVSAILPAASDMDAKREDGMLKKLYLKGLKYLTLVSIPLAFFTIASAQLIMLVWVGPGYEKSAWIIQVLAVGYLANVLAGVGVAVGSAIGRPEFQMRAAIISGVSNLVLSVVLVVIMGFMGVAVATAVSLILGPVYFFIKLHGQLRLSSKKIIREIVSLPFCAAVMPALLICGFHYRLKPEVIVSGRLSSLGMFIVEGMIFLGIYLALILKAGYLDIYDRDLIKRFFLQLWFFQPRINGEGGRC
jgi:O-antigen/teichoic acid export membrane protein